MQTGKLVKVTINREDTCYTYALKRTGNASLLVCENAIRDISGMDIYFEEHPIKTIEDYDKLMPGTIVCWDVDKEVIDVPWCIDEFGEISDRSVTRNRHLGVIESDKSISDCTRKIYDGIPSLRKRFPLVDVKLPNKYYTRK